MSAPSGDHGGGGGNGTGMFWAVIIGLLILFMTGVMDGILNWIRGAMFTFNMYMGVFLVILGAVLWFTRPKKDGH